MDYTVTHDRKKARAIVASITALSPVLKSKDDVDQAIHLIKTALKNRPTPPETGRQTAPTTDGQ